MENVEESDNVVELPDAAAFLIESLSKDIPHLYCNGFTNTLGVGDVLLVLQSGNEAVATVNMSYTLAKTLSEKLGNLIKFLEAKTGNNIMTTDDITLSLKEEVGNA